MKKIEDNKVVVMRINKKAAERTISLAKNQILFLNENQVKG